MARPQGSGEHAPSWITGLVVLAATIIGYIGFAQLSRGWTLVVASAILTGLIVFFWRVGRARRRQRR